MGGFYTGHHTIYTDVYIHIYTLFSTLFRTKFTTKQSLIHYEDHEHHSTHQSSSIATKKIFSTDFHTNSQNFTRFHHQKHQKTPKSPKTRKTRKNRLFGGTPPPPQKPLFSRVFGTPQIAQICTNLHKFAPICTPKTPLLGGTQFAGTLWIDPVRIFAKSGRAGITPILGGYRGGTPSVHNYTPPGPPRLYLNK